MDWIPPSTLQDLPPKAARLCLEVERFVSAELRVDLAGCTALVGLSGGADSTALLLILHYLAPRLGCSVTAVHLDHALRPESAADAMFCTELCAALGVELHTRRTDVAALARERSAGLEEAGREARYALFAELLADHDGGWVLTAHQLDDLSEDVLMRLTRGTGWPELGGMRARDAARRVLRPLLLIPRDAIIIFLNELGAPWREDASNADPAFLRNRMRSRMLPLIRDENPGFGHAVARLWRLARLDEDWLNAELAAVDAQGQKVLPREALDAMHPALRLRAFKAALEAAGPGQPLGENLMRLEEAWAARRVGAVLQFPGGKTAVVTARGVEITQNPMDRRRP